MTRDLALRRMDLLGGHISAFTSKEETILHFCKTTRHTQIILTYFLRALFFDRLSDKDISFVQELVTAATAKYSEVVFLIVGGWQQLFVIFF